MLHLYYKEVKKNSLYVCLDVYHFLAPHVASCLLISFLFCLSNFSKIFRPFFFGLHSFENVFISPSYKKGTFIGYGNVVLQFFFPSTLKLFFYFLLAIIVSIVIESFPYKKCGFH